MTNAGGGLTFRALSLAWAVVVGVVEICVFAQMSGRVAAMSRRATVEHGLVTRLACAAGRTHRNRLPPAESTEPARQAERPAPGSLAWPRDLGLPGDHCGSRRVLTISLQIMINLRFSL